MRFTKWTIAALVLSCAIASQAATQQTPSQEKEKKLKRSDLPAAVQKTLDQESQGATIRGYSSETDNGQLVYEVEMRVRGHGRDVLIGADGSVMEIEEEVALDSVRVALHVKGAPANVVERARRDVEVVRDEVALGQPRLGKEDLARVGYRNFAATDPHPSAT